MRLMDKLRGLPPRTRGALCAAALFVLTAHSQAAPALARRIVEVAQDAPDAARADGTLYGIKRWNAATGRTYLGFEFPGLLACAYTVSAILRKAGYPIGSLASVQQVDAALSSWRKISDANALQPGDVIFWKPRRVPMLGNVCGVSHWHVGISTGGDRTIDNDWRTGQPRAGAVGRTCSVFAFARRPPPGR